jgi:hypothetical protein
VCETACRNIRIVKSVSARDLDSRGRQGREIATKPHPRQMANTAQFAIAYHGMNKRSISKSRKKNVLKYSTPTLAPKILKPAPAITAHIVHAEAFRELSPRPAKSKDIAIFYIGSSNAKYMNVLSN